MSWLWIMSIPSSHLSPHTCVWAGLALRATSPGPLGVKAGGAMGWEMTSAPTALMGFTSGQVRMRSNKRFVVQYQYNCETIYFPCIIIFHSCLPFVGAHNHEQVQDFYSSFRVLGVKDIYTESGYR